MKDMKKKQTNDRKQIKALEEQLQAKDDLVRFSMMFVTPIVCVALSGLKVD